MMSFRLKIGVLVIFQLTSLTLTFCGRFIEWKKCSNFLSKFALKLLIRAAILNNSFRKPKTRSLQLQEEAVILPSSKFALL